MKQTKPRLTKTVMSGLRHILDGNFAFWVLINGIDGRTRHVDQVDMHDVSRAIEWISQMDRHLIIKKGKEKSSC